MNPWSRMRVDHALGRVAVVARVELLAPRRVLLGVARGIAVDERGDELVLRAHDRSRGVRDEVEVEAAQLAAVVLDVGHEEVHRLARDAEVEHHRRVVRDERIGREQQQRRVGEAGDIDDARAGGIPPLQERARVPAHEHDGVRGGGERRGIDEVDHLGPVVAPRRRVQQHALVRTDAERPSRRGAVAGRQHVVARVSLDPDRAA